MIQCPACFTDNVTGATECRDCKKPLKVTRQLCPNGHLMDPAAVECSDCRAEGRLPPRDAFSRSSTTFEAFQSSPSPVETGRKTTWEEQPPMPGPIRSVQPPPPRPAIIPPATANADRSVPSSRKTSFAMSSDVELLRGKEPEVRRPGQKIIGVLVTYTWQPEGQIFPIREGRNRIGSDATQCDITIKQDDTMSGIHSSISFRTKFVISDLDSMSGTYVNGQPVEEQFFSLQNYAEIRTGSTVWNFVILHP